jgi:tRNA modification GTPase
LGRLQGKDGASFDEALVTYFAHRKSFTGEETLEFSTHGSPTIVQLLLQALVEAGAKTAEKGEFTFRAFMNGNLDLVQAESVLALIESQSSLGAKQALRQLKGDLSEELQGLESEITWSLAHIEAGIDFSQEGLETVSPKELLKRLGVVRERLQKRLASYRQGRVIKEGLRVVLMGRPNVGKSSLLNVLLEEERAIVTEIPGTTRDLIEAPLIVAGIKVNLTDTAGLRESTDVVEKMGIERTHRASQDAELILYVVEAGKLGQGGELEELRKKDPSKVVLLVNKVDQVADAEAERTQIIEKLHEFGISPPEKMLFVSAFDKKRAFETVMTALTEWVQKAGIEDQTVLFQARHFERLQTAEENLGRGMQLVFDGVSPELAAFELKEALLCVQETLGTHYDDQILDRVFKEFCLGK